MFGIKDRKFLLSIFENNKNIHSYFYQFLDLFSFKCSNDKLDYLNNLTQEENISHTIAINNELNLIKGKLSQEVKALNKILEKFEIKTNNKIISNELYKFYNIRNKINQKNIQNEEILIKSNIISILYKYFILQNGYIIRDLIGEDRFKYFFIRPKEQIDEEKKNLNLFQKNIIDNIEISKINMNIKVKFGEEKKKIYLTNIYNNIDMYISFIKYQPIINLELSLFNIELIFPFHKKFNYKNFKITVNVLGKKYDENYQKILLYKKLSNLFEIRIYSFFDIIYEEKKNIYKLEKKELDKMYNNEYLIEILKIFVDYINNYDKIFKIKCNICNKLVKYSYNEKCFLPPYYKLYTYKEKLNYMIKDKTKTLNLFVHEECFKKNNSESV